jgi:catechol 2,3-dioxygenase-like lactoylglutathione lyase family enzyme
VRATRINHVSVHAVDMEESIRFYTEVFGMELVPSPDFGTPVEWLRLGEQQLHLFGREVDTPRYHHFGLDVDDFDAVYRKAKERGLLDRRMGRTPVRAHPMGWVQLYLQDPAGNLVEVDWPDVSTLAPDVAADISRLEDEVPQLGDARIATLYTGLEVGG